MEMGPHKGLGEAGSRLHFRRSLEFGYLPERERALAHFPKQRLVIESRQDVDGFVLQCPISTRLARQTPDKLNLLKNSYSGTQQNN